ncbi:hypothetical protein HCW_02330 [Helicobacter cetorum MIT 00-7128]|uniref:tRNA threonylcarbamoyladenosine biosynthesis protein TsaE n=1 Tax=Helicobacter cetorum (strain ATCC BAA-429 / MIT 00-7128) TaxID=182217 RepID=I0ELC8_HELC0|nr:hypothetical protein HCW_02330 [Helicobacter cetorum MIT 00-7128]
MIQANLNELDKIAHEILKDNFLGVVVLKGAVGSGKTTLVQACLKYLNLEVQVTSPTFSLMHAYSESVFHYDFYMRPLEECLKLGMLECLLEEGVHFVEWGDEFLEKILKKHDIPTKIVEISTNNDSRFYTIR